MIALKLKIRYWGARLLFFGFFALLIAIIFFFKISELNIIGLKITNPLYAYTADLEWWLYLLMYFIFVFFINSLIFIVFTIFIRNYKIRSKKRRKKYERIFTDKIMELIYNNSEKSSSIITIEDKISELNALAQKSYTKIILLNILRKIHAQAKDEVRMKAAEILKKMKLDNFIDIYLHSPYFRDKIFAMKIISEFELGMSDIFEFEAGGHPEYIIKLTKKRNYVLRSEAFVSLIKLAIHDDLSFLLDRELHVSIWDMNIVLKIFKDIKNNNINYTQLIESDSPRVAALGVLLANKHNKTDLKEIIFKKIGSKDGLLNFEAYAAFISMANNETDYNFFIEKFSKEDFIIKKAIVKSFANCPSITLSKAFMIYVIEEESLPLKVEAMKILVQLDINRVNEYKNSENIDILKARNQIVDFNLN